MHKKIFLFFLVCSVYAQTTGKISGSIVDVDKNPLIGANISIEGTNIGTSADMDGFYYIINLSPGTYTLKADMIGYKTVQVENITVSVNKTSRIDIVMEQTSIDGEIVYVKASKISVKKDQSGTIKNISDKDIEILPIKDVASIVSMQAGVVDGHFRGGRSTEVTYLLDGVRTDDTYGQTSQTVYLEPSVLKDLEVITGTFNAEYGRAMSGVVNQVTKDGGDKFEISYSSRYENYLTSNKQIFPGINNMRLNLNQDYNFQISGPIIKNNITFFLNLRYQDNLGHLNGYDYFNVSDKSDFNSTTDYVSQHTGSHVVETHCANSNGVELYYPGTVNHITDSSDCGMVGDCEIIYSDRVDIVESRGNTLVTENDCLTIIYQNNQYETGFITTRFMPAKIRDKNDSFVAMNSFISSSALGKITFKLGPSKVSIMKTYNEYEGSWFDNWYKYSPDSRSTNFSQNDFSSIFLNYMFNASSFIDLKISMNEKQDGTYIYENPYNQEYLSLSGIGQSGFREGGQDKVHNKKSLIDLNLKLDFNTQLNSIHNLKLGIDNASHELSVRHYQIVNLSNIEGEYSPGIRPGARISETEEYDIKCYEYSGYIQDKMEFDEMVLNFGLRYDMFDPSTTYPSDYRNPANDITNTNQSYEIDTKAKQQVSPRFALSYQIGYGSLLRFSYGHFFQMPPLYAMYSKANRLIPAGSTYGVILGNPDLEAEKTVNYELGFWQEINKKMSYELVLFNKNIYNLLSVKSITTYDNEVYGLYTNKDYGNARGIELVYDYHDGPLSLVANYTFQYTRGIADSPSTSFSREGANLDPISRLIPLSWDQRHTFNVTFGYNEKKYGATLSAYFNSGTAYTFTPVSESIISNINLLPNNAYKPSNYTLNFSSYYNIQKLNTRITFEVYNVFDTLNEFGVNSSTGRAYSAIINDADVAGFKNNYTTINDLYQNPAQYGAPRSVKLGLEIRF